MVFKFGRWRPDWLSAVIAAIIVLLFIGFTPSGQNFYYDITNTAEGWDGVCTQQIIDECCDENATVERNCPEVPLDTPESQLVAACQQSCGTNGFCYPELDAYTHEFIGCVCLEPSDMNCYDQTTESSCEAHYCTSEGFAKKCAWTGINGGQGCWCPFDWRL